MPKCGDALTSKLGIAYKYVHTCRMQYTTNIQTNHYVNKQNSVTRIKLSLCFCGGVPVFDGVRVRCCQLFRVF